MSLFESLRGLFSKGTRSPASARQAAEAGDAEAQADVGAAYFEARGVERDTREAARWFRLAADQGNAVAQWYLSLMYLNGEGVGRNIVQACKWRLLALEAGIGPANAFFTSRDPAFTPYSPAAGGMMKDHLRAKILSAMTPAQIEAALAEIKAFKDARASAGPTPG